jgi:aspartate aminotransferase
MPVSKKMLGFSTQSSMIRKMFEEGARMKARYGADNVFDFSLGNPDVPPPALFNQAIREVAADEAPGIHAYMPNAGYPWVREIIAERMSEEQGISIKHDDVLMTCGAAGALNVVLKALLNPGDEVLLLAPYFVEYNFYIDNHGGVSKVVKTDKEFNLDLAAIETAITNKTKALIINSPNNPTGQIYSQEALNALGNLLEEAGRRLGIAITLISDEPYRKIVFEGHTVASIFKAYSNSVVLSSYSKDLSLPGERIGYMAVHPDIADKAALVDALTLANRILGFVNAPALMQRVVARLKGVSVDSTVYERRREIFCALLKSAGYDFIPPKGAFYIFPQSPIADDVAFCSILQEEKILAVPGKGFGLGGYFRLAFCIDEKIIQRSAQAFATARIKAKKLPE